MIKKFLPALLMVFGFVAALTACNKINTPEYTAKRFCTFTKTAHFDAPEEILTQDLIDAINIAMKKNAKIVDAAPDEKPPLGDGIPYQSHPDTTPVCETGVPQIEGDIAKVEIRHIFPDDAKSNWSDFIVLKHIGRDWKIDNIIYDAVDSDENLRNTLVSIFDDN